MTSIKNIVKVMNFHSLIRVDKARKTAEKYFLIEKELTKMIGQLVYNRNLNLDKKILKANENGVTLNIYIGSDLGFCGNFNYQLQKAIKNDPDSEKIIIGKKIFPENKEKIKLIMTKEEFYHKYSKVENIIYDYIMNGNLKEINVLYNHYYNINTIKFENKKLFPVVLDESIKQKLVLNIDYIIETDIYRVITSMIALYICYQINILESNSWASENVMRQQITNESIDKISSIEEEKERVERKEKKYEAFKKQINNYKNIGEE